MVKGHLGTYAHIVLAVTLVAGVALGIPMSSSDKVYPTDMPVLELKDDAILLNGSKASSVANVARISAQESDPIIKGLKRRLENLLPDSGTAVIGIRAEKRTDFHTMFTLLNTAGTAGFKNIYLYVINSNSGDTTSIPVNLPKGRSSWPPIDASTRLFATFIVADTVLTFGARGGFLPGITLKPSFDVGVDIWPTNVIFADTTISSWLRTLHAKYAGYPDADQIIVAFEADALYGNIVRIMDATYSAGFTEISVAKLRVADKLSKHKTRNVVVFTTRPKESIQKVVMENLHALREIYREHQKNTPGLKGRITVKFAIDETGQIIFAKATQNTTGNEPFELALLETIKEWRFEPVDKPGDVTEIVYPFDFAPEE